MIIIMTMTMMMINMNDHYVVNRSWGRGMDGWDAAWQHTCRAKGHRCSEISQGISVGNAQEICFNLFKQIFEQVLLFRKRRGLNHAKPPSRWRIPVFSLWLPSKATVALQPCLLRQRKAQLPQIQLLLPRQEVSESNTSCPSCEAAPECLPVSFCDSAVAILGFEYVKKTSENARPELGGKVHWRQTISPSMLWHATIAHQGSNDLFTQKKHRVREEFVSFEKKNEVSLGAPSTVAVFPLLRPRCQSVTTSTEGSHLGPATQPIFGGFHTGSTLGLRHNEASGRQIWTTSSSRDHFRKATESLNPILGFGDQESNTLW